VENLKHARKSAGIRQSDLAKMLGVSQGNISDWERGLKNPSAQKVRDMAEILGVSADYLLDVSSEASSQYLLSPHAVSMTRAEMHKIASGEGIQLSAKNERDIIQQIEALHKDLTSPQTLMLSGEVLDDETLIALRAALEKAIVMAKTLAKKKFTPKKFRHARPTLDK